MEEENTETHTTIPPAFLRKTEPPGQNSAMGPHGVHKSLQVFRRSRRRRREGCKELKMQHIKEATLKEEGGGCVSVEKVEGGGEEEEDDREEVERKIHALQRIVPGGESLGVDMLFDETAGYIMALQCQVKALKTLAGFFEKLEKEKAKFGG